jgi:hypothetical protein
VVKERQSRMVIALLRTRIMTAKRDAMALFDAI